MLSLAQLSPSLFFLFDNWSLDILINLSVHRVLFHQCNDTLGWMVDLVSILIINGNLVHKSLGQACKHDWENFKFLCDFSNYLILTRTYWSLTPLSLIPPKHYENASSLLVFIRFSDFISGKPFNIVAYMLSEILSPGFGVGGGCLLSTRRRHDFLLFFWELYQPAGCYRLSSAVLRKLGMVWLSADGPPNSHFDIGYDIS